MNSASTSRGRVLKRGSLLALPVLALVASMPLDPFLREGGFVDLPVAWMLTGVVILIALFILLTRKRTALPRSVLGVTPLLLAIPMWSVATLMWADCNWLLGGERTAITLLLMGQVVAVGVIGRSARIPVAAVGRVLGIAVVGLAMHGAIQGTLWRGSRLIPVEGYNPSWLGAYAAASLLALVAERAGGAAITEALPSTGTTAHMSEGARGSRAVRWFDIALGVGLVGTMLWTQSRNTLVSLVAAGLLTAALFALSHAAGAGVGRTGLPAALLATGFRGAAVAACAVAGAFWGLSSGFGIGIAELDRIAMLTSGDSYAATAGRTEIWSLTLAGGVGAGGIGAGCFESWYAARYHIERTPHNQWLLTFVEMGVVGLFLMLATAIAGMVAAWRARRRCGWIVVAIATFLLVMSIGNDVLFYQYWWVGLSVVALIVVNARDRATMVVQQPPGSVER